ncbi:hypothetical protein BASA81_006395 [Batrachochytrium salamandrivorans]|nr:hypothetical protein BASA81_006395 [Batrachochytrium salamandrivorans]
MRVCLVQLEVCKSSARVEDRLAHISSKLVAATEGGELDLILLPEMAFSNYCLSDELEALDKARREPEIMEWAKQVAVQYSCYLAFGLVGANNGKPENKLVVVSPAGQVVHEQIKRFLYYSDLKWTRACASQFVSVELTLPTAPQTKVQAMFAICNDINGPDFKEMDQFHLATAAMEQRVQVLFLSAAWCSAHPKSPRTAHDEEITPSDQLEYWYQRLLPLVGSKCYFCVADLVGREPLNQLGKRIRYCGTSCFADMQTSKLLAPPCGTSGEQVLIADLLL